MFDAIVSTPVPWIARQWRRRDPTNQHASVEHDAFAGGLTL
ncbi:MAG: hypothetical protein WAW03_21155 [Anaerolineae bacterium]